MRRETIWVNAFSRTHEVVSHHRIDMGEQLEPLDPAEPAKTTSRSCAIHVERAYENVVILDDPQVAAHHLILLMDEDGA